MNSEWSMPRRAEECTACRRAFEIGETFQALLYEVGETYVRRDYCLTCTPDATQAPLGTWRTRRPEPAARKATPFDREALYALFARLEDAREPQPLQLRFVLALLLWRKRVLKLERTLAADRTELWEFTVPRSEVTHRVTRPHLDEARLEVLSAQLEDLLAGAPAELDDLAAQVGKELPDAN